MEVLDLPYELAPKIVKNFSDHSFNCRDLKNLDVRCQDYEFIQGFSFATREHTHGTPPLEITEEYMRINYTCCSLPNP